MRRSLISRVFPKILVILLMFSFVTVGVGSVFAQEDLTPIPMISGIEMLKVGDQVPDFEVGDISGTSFNMQATLESGKGVLIFFWSIFCEPCKAELPVIQSLSKVYKPKGISFVGVSIDGSPMKDAISAFVKQEDFGFLPLIDELNPDESFKVSDPYGVAGTPTVYIIDGNGVVKFAKVGRASEEELEKVIKQML
ncbi:MAG: TlpA disulfide reductase family protein [bacterium]|nr:TlpA disulfide reductase family protein [bacterium]MDT8365933.1 TlpA disulfide reductase family protein [bacterium]